MNEGAVMRGGWHGFIWDVPWRHLQCGARYYGFFFRKYIKIKMVACCPDDDGDS